MQSSIVQLHPGHRSDISRLLKENEQWNMIPFDSFLRYGLSHPAHVWFGELVEGKLTRSLYMHKELVHLVSTVRLPPNSGFYQLLNRLQNFIIHGKKDSVESLIKGLKNHRSRRVDFAQFVQQSSSTYDIARSVKLSHSDISVRNASSQDYSNIMRLYHNSSIDHLVDPSLIQELIQYGRVILAEKKISQDMNRPGSRSSGELLGTIMNLKESANYVLLGGLYVDKKHRKQGIASILGQKAILETNARNKKICFYFNDQKLKKFYGKISFKSLGKWVSYAVTSKALT